ncbi:MAG: MarR family transcriptional regulator [Moraxella osloensis]
MQLTPTMEKFVLHWGEMGNKWGVNRTVAQIHALLFLAGKPMNAEEIQETLGVARSNVSNSIKELQSLNLVQTVHTLGDRRDYFTTGTDVWELAKVIVEERYRRELAPTVGFLADLINEPEFATESKDVATYQRHPPICRYADELGERDAKTFVHYAQSYPKAWGNDSSF